MKLGSFTNSSLNSETHRFKLDVFPTKPAHVGIYILKIELEDNGNDQPYFLDQ
jgi:hypothetical protein